MIERFVAEHNVFQWELIAVFVHFILCDSVELALRRIFWFLSVRVRRILFELPEHSVQIILCCPEIRRKSTNKITVNQTRSSARMRAHNCALLSCKPIGMHMTYCNNNWYNDGILPCPYSYNSIQFNSNLSKRQFAIQIKIQFNSIPMCQEPWTKSREREKENQYTRMQFIFGMKTQNNNNSVSSILLLLYTVYDEYSEIAISSSSTPARTMVTIWEKPKRHQERVFFSSFHFFLLSVECRFVGGKRSRAAHTPNSHRTRRILAKKNCIDQKNGAK